MADREDVNVAPSPGDDGDAQPLKRSRTTQHEDATVGPAKPAPKQKKVLKFEHLYLNSIPSAEMYEKSYLHRDVVTHVATTVTDFFITGSVDGHIKFWKKQVEGIDFVKHFRAHLAPITSMSVSHDGLLMCSTSEDKSFKVYDVVNFDMINMIKTPFTPSASEWIFKKGAARAILAVASKETQDIYIYDPQSSADPVKVLSNIHRAPVALLKYNAAFHCVVSTDVKGLVEYWDADSFEMPKCVKFQFKTDTDLYDFVKRKAVPVSLSLTKDGKHFACMASDRQVTVFKFLEGKITRRYDESLARFNALQKDNQTKLDPIDFGRRMAVERDIDKAGTQVPASQVLFDDSGYFLLYPTMIGIKVVNLVTNKVVRVIGRVESTERFLAMALYQNGVAAEHSESIVVDPTLLCSAFKKHRLYLFSTREPKEPDPDNPLDTGRDVFNERPQKEEQAMLAKPVQKHLATTAVLHTTAGDICIKLFPKECPKTVENFTTHSKNGYYNGCIFHRVIKGFMIQTGDPLGDGTGGTSIWGHDFEDEFHRDLRHDRPFTVSMANAGPNTNGSQFFITTVPITRLDGKHTVFGRVYKGMETVMEIEKSKTDKTDKPLKDISILSVTVGNDDAPSE